MGFEDLKGTDHFGLLDESFLEHRKSFGDSWVVDQPSSRA
jgi:hypothetical protein